MEKVGNTVRYELLDGLRGVAALVVLMYHLFEAIAFSQNLEIERLAQAQGVEAQLVDQNFFHGFLAVDFFFILWQPTLCRGAKCGMAPQSPSLSSWEPHCR